MRSRGAPQLTTASHSQADRARAALRAVAALLADTLGAAGPDAARVAMAREARILFDAPVVVVTTIARDERSVEPSVRDPDTGSPWNPLALEDCREILDVLTDQARSAVLEDMRIRPAELLGAVGCERVLLLPVRTRDGVRDLLLIGRSGAGFEEHEIDSGLAFADAAGARLGELRDTQRLAAQRAQQGALVRAAEALNEDLNVPRLLSAIGREAASMLGADLAAVWLGDAERGVTVEAVHGFPPEVVGYHLPSGEGIAGQVAQTGRSELANDYRRIAPADSPFFDVKCCLGVPLYYEGKLHGVLAVGYARPHTATESELAFLEAFAQLADVAVRNASQQ